jgi:hypothetical protein
VAALVARVVFNKLGGKGVDMLMRCALELGYHR